MTSKRVVKMLLPAALVIGLVLAAIPLVSSVGRDPKSVATDTVNQAIGGLTQAKGYLQGSNSSGLSSTVNDAITNLQSALDSLSNGGNISAVEQALQEVDAAFAKAENQSGGLNNETTAEQTQYLSEAISRAQSRAFQISNYTQQLKNSTLGAQLFANVTAATQLLSAASLQLQSGNLTGAQASLQSALAILDNVNLAVGGEQENEDMGQNQSEYQGKLGAAINQTLSEIADIRNQLSSSSISQGQRTQALSLLDNATALLSSATAKLNGGDTQGAWGLFDQAKISVSQAQNLVEGDSASDD